MSTYKIAGFAKSIRLSSPKKKKGGRIRIYTDPRINRGTKPDIEYYFDFAELAQFTALSHMLENDIVWYDNKKEILYSKIEESKPFKVQELKFPKA